MHNIFFFTITIILKEGRINTFDFVRVYVQEMFCRFLLYQPINTGIEPTMANPIKRYVSGGRVCSKLADNVVPNCEI